MTAGNYTEPGQAATPPCDVPRLAVRKGQPPVYKLNDVVSVDVMSVMPEVRAIPEAAHEKGFDQWSGL